MEYPEAHRALRVSSFGSIAAGLTGQPQRFSWPIGGFVIGIMAHSLGDGSLAGMASLAIKIESNVQDLSIFGSDTGADFVTFFSLHGPSGLQAFKVMRNVAENEIWTCTCRNYHSATTYTPEVTFYWRKDAPAGWAPLYTRR